MQTDPSLPGLRRRELSSKDRRSESNRSFLPASHHHLDIPSFLLFLLRRGIYLGRHDCPRQRKSRPGGGLGRCGARRGSATDAGPGARLLRRTLARTGGPTHAARRPGSPARTGDLSRTSRTEYPILSLPGNSATTRRHNLKKDPSCQANSSAGAQSTMGRDVVAGSPPSGRGPQESEKPVCPRARARNS